MANLNSTRLIESLAAEIGDGIYLDIAKWRLYLSNARLHTILAERLYPLMVDGSWNESKVLEVLRSIPIQLGGGRHELPLLELLPIHCQVDLMHILEEFQKNNRF